MKSRLNHIVLLFACAFAAAVSCGCSMQKMAGNAIMDFSRGEAIPYLMSQGDLESACQMGQAMGPVLMSFRRVGLNPEQIGIGTQMAAGMCAEFRQREDELARYRALGEGRAGEAQDALAREKQAHRLAASRMISAYENAVAVYGDLSESCPKYGDDTDALLSLLGLASGALAILHDFNSEKQVGISLDIPRKIEKGAQCFDDAKWWGMPSALRAAIWLSIPGSGPEGVDPLETMKLAAEKGDAQGVFLARAMLVMMAATVGRSDMMCEAMQNAKTSGANGDFDMLNAYAQGLIRHQADIAWTKQKGYRAPLASAQCPEAPSAAIDAERADDLLDGLLDGEDADETSESAPTSASAD